MNVSMTEVATTMRTRFESGGTAPEPADMFKVNNGRYIRTPADALFARPILNSLSPDSTPNLLIFFQHALGRFYSRYNNYRHSADQSRKKQVFEDRQNVVDRKSTRLNSSHIPLSR